MARPTVITKDVLQKLEQAFALDCGDEEACFYADIAPSTLYAYQQKNKGFLERKQLLRQRPVLKARMELINGFAGNPAICLKYLERKRPEEFRVDVSAEDLTWKEKYYVEVEKYSQSLKDLVERVRAARDQGTPASTQSPPAHS